MVWGYGLAWTGFRWCSRAGHSERGDELSSFIKGNSKTEQLYIFFKKGLHPVAKNVLEEVPAPVVRQW
jgi:hypothetical protein